MPNSEVVWRFAQRLCCHSCVRMPACIPGFRTVTSLRPLQYQKRLRLQEARRILFSEAFDTATVSRQVGYESPLQFYREYRRFFGSPSMRDIERLPAASGPSQPNGDVP